MCVPWKAPPALATLPEMSELATRGAAAGIQSDAIAPPVPSVRFSRNALLPTISADWQTYTAPPTRRRAGRLPKRPKRP